MMLSRPFHLLLCTLMIGLCPHAGLASDCNGNGVQDSVDISSGTSEDCQGNGIPDDCEVRGLYAGTQSDRATGEVGHVLIYRGQTDWEDITDLTWDVAAAELVVERGVPAIGIDYLSIDRFNSPDSLAHMILLGAGVPIIESVDLDRVAPGRYEMIALPLKIPGAEGSPARVILRRIAS